MATMDIFNDDAFSMTSLAGAIDKVPYVPGFLGAQNLFEPRPVTTETVAVEKVDGVLSIVQTSERGAPLERQGAEKRDIRDFRSRRIAKSDTIRASEIQGVRAWGSETELQQVQQVVARRQMRLRRDVELTHENMRLGAVQGIVLDADGSTIYNWFTEWGISQAAEIDFALTTATTDVRGKCSQVIRQMQQAGKGAFTTATQVHALASNEFYDALIAHPLVRDTYLNWAAAMELRDNPVFRSFPFGGITFHNYRGTDDGSTVVVPANKCKFYPAGATDVFEVAYSPGETFDWVNTPGQPIYSLIVPDRDRNTFVDVELYSYPLYLCNRPEMLQRAKKA